MDGVFVVAHWLNIMLIVKRVVKLVVSMVITMIFDFCGVMSWLFMAVVLVLVRCHIGGVFGVVTINTVLVAI